MSTKSALRPWLFAFGVFAFALPASAAPSLFFTDLPTGPLTGGPGNHGAPVALYGHGFGATRGNSKVTIGGVEVAAYLEWGQNNANNSRLDRITVQPGPQVTGGPVVVTVNGVASNADITFTPNRGRVLYMAATGSDGASCSETSPCKSLLGLLGGKLKPGDVALVRTGTYLDDEVWIRAESGMSGTPAQRKTIKAYPGERPVFARGPRGVAIEASYLTFSGLHFRNGKGIGVTDNYANKAAIGRGIWIIDNTVIGPIAYEGMGSHGSDHLFAGNVVRVQGSSQGTQGHCFYISHGDNVKLLYNQADGAPGYGIHVYDQVRQQKDFRRTITNLLIEGNVLTGSPERSGMLITVDDGGDWGTYGNYGENIVVRNNVFARNNHTGMVLGGILRNVKIYNNTFFENGRQGLLIADSPSLSGIEIRNNLFYQSANNGVCRANCSWYSVAHIHDGGGQPSRITIDNNGYFPGAKIILKGKSAGTPYDTDAHATTNATAATLFANPANLDLSLLPASAAIDRGAPLPAVARDFNGGQRPTGKAPDLGAFEFGSGGGAPASLPASALTVPASKPGGRFDGISSNGTASGWAQDATDPKMPLTIHLYIDKNSGTPGATPLEAIADPALPLAGRPGFFLNIPNAYRDGKPHQAWAWALDPNDPAELVPLDGNPKSFQLAPPKRDKNAAGKEPCSNGPIKKACLCGDTVRSDNFCCNGAWNSYDACKQQ